MTVRLKVRTQLTLAYTSIALLLMLSLGFALYIALYRELNEAADAELNSQADGIVHFLQKNDERGETAQMPEELQAHSELNAKADIFQLRDSQGMVLYRSPAMQNLPVSTRAGSPFSNLRVGRKTYRVLRRKVNVSQHYILEGGSDRSEYYEALEGLRTFLLLGIPLTLCLSFVAGLWMSGRVLPTHPPDYRHGA